MEDLVGQAIQYAADELSSYAFAAGIDAARGRISNVLLGQHVERTMRAVFSRAVARMLHEMRDRVEVEGDSLDVESVEVVRELLGDLFSDGEAARTLLRVAIQFEPMPLDALRRRFSELGYNADTLPIDFDRALVVLAERLYDEFATEAERDNSPLQPLVNRELLSASRAHAAVLKRLVGGSLRTGFTVEDALLTSEVRCTVRWQALGVSREEAATLAADPAIGAAPPELVAALESGARDGRVTILSAALGAGKSLALERVYQRALSRLSEKPECPLPVFLRASEVSGPLRDAVEARTPPGDPSRQGCLLCLDGIEAPGFSRASELLEEARELADAWPTTAVFIASRPVQGLGHEWELEDLPPLSEGEAQQLYDGFSGRTEPLSFPRDWPDSLKDAVRRPLFAILAGLDHAARRGSWRSPRSLGELMSGLVERALDRTEFETAKAQLTRLAVLATDRGGGPVQRAEVASPWQGRSLRRSGLILEDEGTGSIAFSLPILEEWFAAGALGSSAVDLDALSRDPVKLGRWRYPLAIAVGALDHETTSRILTPIVQHSPSDAARAIADGLAKYGSVEDGTGPAPQEWAYRIRQAMAVWIDGLGPLAALVAPINEVSRDPAWEALPPEEYPAEELTLAPLGVGATGGGISALGWYRGVGRSEEVLELTEQGRMSEPPWHWPKLHYLLSAPGRQPSWAWRQTFDELEGELSKLLNRRMIPLNDGLPAAKEQAWLEARNSATGRRRAGEAINLDDLRFHLSYTGPDVRVSTIERPGRRPQRFYPRYLHAELRRLREAGVNEMRPPWPTSDRAPDSPELDRPGRSSVAVWSLYSPERLLERARVVFDQMLETYRWVVKRYFSRLAPAMATWAMLPARVTGTLYYGRIADYPAEDRPPVLSWYLDPLPEGAEGGTALELYDRGTECVPRFWDMEPPGGRAAILEAARKGRELRPSHSSEAISAVSHYSGSVLYLSEDPVRELTYQTLWNDLRNAGWVHGSLRAQ